MTDKRGRDWVVDDDDVGSMCYLVEDGGIAYAHVH
jgi:hypothetical protein